MNGTAVNELTGDAKMPSFALHEDQPRDAQVRRLCSCQNRLIAQASVPGLWRVLRRRHCLLQLRGRLLDRTLGPGDE